MTDFVVFDLVSSVPSQKIGWEERPEMTYFVSRGIFTEIQSINST